MSRIKPFKILQMYLCAVWVRYRHQWARNSQNLRVWVNDARRKFQHYKYRAYSSGAISSIDIQDAYVNFKKSELVLRKAGYIPVNPMEIHPDNLTYIEYIFRDLVELATCGTIYMQPNWKQSTGAKIELTFAIITFKHVIYG